MVKKLLFSLCFCIAYTYCYADLITDDLKHKEVHFVQFLFADLNGSIKELVVPMDHVQDALEHGLLFDGSSVAGCAHISESDMLLKPDVNTMRILPWLQGANKTAIMLCDIYLDADTPYEGDPRFVLKKTLRELADQGYACNVGPELEFFLLDSNNQPLDMHSYFTAETNVQRVIQKQSLLHLLKGMQIDVEKLHHEVATGQHEFSIRYGNPLDIADQLLLAKYTLKSVLHEYGIKVSFMPKPFESQNGSAMHIHFSLWDMLAHKNVFYDAHDPYNLSTIGRQCIAGILHHTPAMTALFNPTVNSFKRLVPGYEAPIFICWGTKNRSALIRIPESNSPNSLRAEYRSPDPYCNPYLAFAALCKASSDGIKNKRKAPDAIEDNMYKLSDQQRDELAIQLLPANLEQAVYTLHDDSFMHTLLGANLHENFVTLKQKELRSFATTITDWELKQYLY